MTIKRRDRTEPKYRASDMTAKHTKNHNSVVKFVSARGRPSLLVPGEHLHYCDEKHIPILIVWKRTVYADVTWLNDSLVLIHRDLFEREEFKCRPKNTPMSSQNVVMSSHFAERVLN
ncbi:hypothetical protein [Escherichia coli]|uniref:hypothetical protein n=1 Tax=Escherichia coli TaxID=562 RepID=UPI0003917A14|nr:hypothetical protein [Escherichia coli]EQZ90958.1 hypothetical protein G991_02255 [Escherichia coli UMEA 3703-1]